MRSFQPPCFRFRTSVSNRAERPSNRMSLKTVTSARPKSLMDEMLSFMSRGIEPRFSPARTQKYSPR